MMELIDSRAHKMDFDGRSSVVQMTQLVTSGTQKVTSLRWEFGFASVL